MTSLAARLSLLLAPVCILGSLACAKASSPAPTPAATRTPRPSGSGIEQELSYEQRLQNECPPEDRVPCVSQMLQLLRSTGDLGRVALCVDRGGQWLVRWEKEEAPTHQLPIDARAGDHCPDAFPYAIRGIYVQGAAR